MSAIVKELIAGGIVDSRGVFTVDTKKAQEKLERFRLPDPLGYVVELVQAAGLSAASRVDVEVTPSLFRLRFDGRAFSAADLTDLESALLVRNDHDHPARQQLALGVSAAQALNPRFVSVQSETAKLVLDDDGPRLSSTAGQLDAIETPFTTVIEVQESFGAGHFVEFFAGVFGMQKEERLLADRCRHARFQVSVNGVVVSGKPPPCDVQVDVIDDELVGRFGFRFGSAEPGRLLLLRAGVVQESIVFADEAACAGLHVPRGFVAVVEAPHLPRDASFTRFIRNDAFGALVRASLWRSRQAAEQLSRIGDNGSVALAVPEQHRQWAWQVARDVLQHMGPEARTTTNKQLAALRALPLFTDALGAPLTLDTLLDDVRRHGHAATLGQSRKALHLNPPRPVLLLDGADGPDVQLWMSRLDLPLQDITDAADAAEKRERSQVQFRARRSNCTLPSGSFAAQLRFDASANERGVMGFREHGGEPAHIIVVVDGCELAHLLVPFAVAGLTIVIEGPFTPSFGYDDVVRNAALSLALVRAAAALPALLQQQMRSPSPRRRAALLACLGLVVDGNALATSLRAAAGCPKVPFDLPLLGENHACATTRLFTTMTGSEVSIDALKSGEGPIGVVGVDTIDFAPSLTPTLRADELLRLVLRKLVPLRPLVSMNDEAVQARRRKELRGRSRDPLSLADVSGQVTIKGEGRQEGRSSTSVVTGVVGHRPAAQRGKLELGVFVEGRRLQVTKVPAPVSGLVASLNDDELLLTSKLNPIGSPDYLVDVALSAVPKLIAALADPWPLAFEVVGCLLPTDEHRRGLASLQAHLPANEVGPAYGEVLLLSTSSTDGEVAAALELLLAEGAVPTVDRLGPVVGSKKKAATSDGRTRLMAAVCAPADEPLLTRLLQVFGIDDIAIPRLDQATTSVSEVLAQPVLRYVGSAVPLVPGFEDVVVLSPSLLSLVQRLREPPMVNVTVELASAAARLAFEQKQQVTPVIGPKVVSVALLAFDDDGLRGEVALLAGPASVKPQAELLLLHKSKVLVRLPVGQFLGMSMQAAVDVDDLTPTANFDGVEHNAKLTRVIERVRAARDELVAGLLDELDTDDNANDGTVGVNDVAVRARLLERLRISHTNKNQPLPTQGLAARIGGLVFFPSVAGVRLPLRDQGGDDDCVRFVTAAVSPADCPPGFEDVVVIARAAERDLMEKIIAVDDVDKAFGDATRRHQTRQRLPALSFDIVDDGLVQHSTRLGQAELRLGLPRWSPEQVRLQWRVGVDGLLVETLEPSWLPFQAVLSGDNVVAKDLRSARVDDKLRASIEREGAALWRKAIELFCAPGSSDNDDERRALRTWLRHAALLMVDADDKASWVPALRSRLFDLRLFALDGGFISLNTAMQEQPPPLAKLLRDYGLARAPAVVVAPATTPALAPRQVDPRPEPEPAEPESASDEERLRERLLSLLAVVRDRSKALTSDLRVHRILMVESKVWRAKVAVRLDNKASRVLVDISHPLSQAALSDSAALAMLASLVVSRINEQLDSVSDDDERLFLSSLIAHARTFDDH